MSGAAPAAGPPRGAPDPYRLLFPAGLAFSLAAAVVWTLHAAGVLPYPGALHRVLVLEGYQTSFVLGFLLTAMVGFMRNPRRCGPVELGLAAAANVACGAAALAGWLTLAHLMFLVSVVVLSVVLLRRYLGRAADPPEEFLFVAFGLVTGIAAGIVVTSASRGLWFEPAPGFGARLVAYGMVLPIVLGLGGLLVPTFAGLPRPLAIEGVAGPHERPGRRRLYSAVIALLAAAIAADGLGHGTVASWLRALAATPMVWAVWKVLSPGGHRTVSAASLRAAGLLALTGLWLSALLPMRPLAGFHLVMLGGFGLLTLAIATRVVVVHGGHPFTDEPRVLHWSVPALVALAALARMGAEFGHSGRDAMLAWSGALWSLGWLVWAARAVPRIVRRGRRA